MTDDKNATPRIAPVVSQLAGKDKEAKDPLYAGAHDHAKDRRHTFIALIVALACVCLIGVSAYALLAPEINNEGGGLFQTVAEPNKQASPQVQNTENADAGVLSTENALAGTSSSAGQQGVYGEGPQTEWSSASSTGESSSNNTPPAQSDSTSAPLGTSQDDLVSVQVSVSSTAAKGEVSASAAPTFQYGATAYDALCACGLSVNASQSAFGVYVSAIGGLAEFDYGAMSGWKYAVNGVEGSYAASEYILKNNDVVTWYYTV